MKRTFIFNITIEDSNKSVSEFLRSLGFSHHIITKLKKSSGSVLCNEESVYLNKLLREGDVLTILYVEEEDSKNIVPSNIPLDILYEDEDILLINKQAGTPVHPSIMHYENTVANGLCYYFKNKGENFTFRCINRLDLNTTGLILIAKHAVSGCILSEAMKKRKIKREYIAVVQGMTPPKGKICAPISRAENSIIERCVDFENGETAITNYERINYNDGYSLIRLHLDTGRTHQIRVHFNYIGHPLPGDYLYNPVYDKINRQPLHSHKLKFNHPVTGEAMEFTAKLPDDFNSFYFSSPSRL